SLRREIALFTDSAEKLSDASSRLEASRAALGDVSLASLASDLAALGTDPSTELRGRRQKHAAALETARAAAAKAATDLTLAEERSRAAKASMDAAIVARDVELAKFPEGLSSELAAAQAAAAAAAREQATVAADMDSLERTIADQAARIDA